MIAPTVDPSAEDDVFANVAGIQFAASVGSEHVGSIGMGLGLGLGESLMCVAGISMGY